MSRPGSSCTDRQNRAHARTIVTDLVCGSALILATGAAAVVGDAFTGRPFEDAAILLRYSQHVAEGLGVVWNSGGRPTYGATDTLFMLLVAVLRALGLPLVLSARVLDFVASSAIAVICCCTTRRWFHVGLVGLLPGLLLAVGPGWYFTRAAFGTPVFALAVCLVFLGAVRLVIGVTPTLPRMWALSCFVVVLARPEGIVVVGLLAPGVLVLAKEHRRAIAVALVTMFIAPSIAYFAFQWIYFGHPLPVPFYKKGGGKLYWSGLRASRLAVVHWLAPMGGAYILPVVSQRHRSQVLALGIIPIGGFTLVWLFLSPETNYASRFQYPALVMFAASIPVLWHLNRSALQGWRTEHRDFHRGLDILALVAVMGMLVSLTLDSSHLTFEAVDGNADVGAHMARFSRGGLLLATSEAGLLPLISGWRTLDLWGLNDFVIARHGLSAAYLEQQDPAVVMLHEFPRPGGGFVDPVSLGPAWTRMTVTTNRYIETHDYVLVASFGNRIELWKYWVRNSAPGASQLAAAIRQVQVYRTADGSFPDLLKSPPVFASLQAGAGHGGPH